MVAQFLKSTTCCDMACWVDQDETHERYTCTTRVRRDGVEEKEATESVQTCVGDKFPEVTAPNNLLFAVSS